MKSMNRLNAALVMLREAEKLTQQQVAEKLGYRDKSSVNSIEQGNPTVKSLGSYLDAIGKDIHDLADALDVVNGRTKETLESLRAISPGMSADQMLALGAILKRLEALENIVRR